MAIPDLPHERTRSDYRIRLPGPVAIGLYDDLVRIPGIDPDEVGFGSDPFLTYAVSAEQDTPTIHDQVKACVAKWLA